MGLEEDVAALTARVAELEQRLTELSAPVAPSPPPPGPPIGPPIAGVPPPPGGMAPPLGGTAPPLGGTAPPPGGVVPGTMAAAGVGPSVGAARPGPPDWLTTETLLRWAGLLLVVLAAIFFVATAIGRGWIGPELQLLGATLIGLALLAAAVRLGPDRRPWAIAFGCGGAVVVPICAAAANAELDLIGPYPALVALAVAVVVVTAVAWVRAMEPVAALGAVTAGFAMLWVVGEADLPPLVPGSWLVVVAVAASAVGWVRGWTVARLVVVFLSGLELLTLLIDGPDLTSAERTAGVSGVLLLGAVALLGPVVEQRFTPTTSAWRSGLDRRSVVPVPL
ncbi:MAG: DUF2339 domain-containing protein, partial [Actinomycetota bacterium]